MVIVIIIKKENIKRSEKKKEKEEVEEEGKERKTESDGAKTRALTTNACQSFWLLYFSRCRSFSSSFIPSFYLIKFILESK